MRTFDYLKHLWWRWFVYPIYPYIQPVVAALPIVRDYDPKNARQRFHLGWLAPGRSFDDFLAQLAARGFQNHFIAWQDGGQVVSIRKIIDYRFQYHIRLFADGEIRGHYEYTPECRPFKHLTEALFEPRREEFLAYLGNLVVEGPPADIPEFAGRQVGLS